MTRDTEETIAALYLQGKPVREIMYDFCISNYRVYQILKKTGASPSWPTKGHTTPCVEVRQLR